MAFPYEKLRIAAAADLHCTVNSRGAFQSFFSDVSSKADVLLLCGDLTDYGLPEEASVLAKELTSAATIPILAVLGNHDYESGKETEVRSVIANAGVHLLDGDAQEVHGVGFAGVKGFCGGFGDHTLQAWGELRTKEFVSEAVQESLRLEKALSRLRTQQRICLLHYSPIRATVENEPLEIFPFLGSSRLEEPIDRYPVAAVFHGHAHHGTPEGATRGGVKVYNVAMPLLRRVFPGQPPYRIIELPVGTERDLAHHV